jgi:hypothetical protein
VRHAGPARALALAGAVLELAADRAMTRRLHAEVRPAYDQPAHHAARACTMAGAALMAFGHRSRRAAVAGGLTLCAGSALERLAVIRAGRASAAEPAATVGPQRARLST